MTSLTPPPLDDVAFADLTSAAIERIPVESSGRWTLHAPVDPGITFLELFAYQLDQRLYWLDRVPDALLRGILTLLGQTVEPASPATTVLRLLDASVPPRAIAAGARFNLRGADVAFTTVDDVRLLPVRRIGVEVDATDRGGDLAAGRPVALLGALRIVLYLDPGAPPAPGGHAALLLRLDGPGDPQWLAVADVPPPATLRFAHRGGAFAAGEIEDGTGGLRRSGILRFRVPAGWQPDGPPESDGAVAYSLTITAEDPTFTTPPRLLEIVPNVTVARHLAAGKVDEDDLERQAAEWLPLPGRELDLAAAGTLASATLSLRERDGDWHEWQPADDLAFAGPGDRVFLTDRERGVLRFGDGLTGRIPVPHADAPRVRATFQIGAGPSGNAGPSREWDAPGDERLTAVNPVAPEGGEDAQTLADARRAAAESLLRVERAVTGRDHETLAETTPGVDVARSHAAVGFHPGHPCDPVPGAVTVFVVPGAPREDFDDPLFVATPHADPGLLAAVAKRLADARLLAGEVFVARPRYRTVGLVATVAGQPPDPERLRHAIAADLRRYLDPLAGGDDADGWPFGDPLRPSALLRRAQDAVGTEAQVVSVAVGLDGAAPDQDCLEVPIGAHDLVVLSAVALRWTAATGREGGLR